MFLATVLSSPTAMSQVGGPGGGGPPGGGGGPPGGGGAANTCWFQAKGLAMNFGNLDPSIAANVSNVPVQEAALNATRWGDCAPALTMSMTADNGLYFSGSRRMKRISPVASNDFIPYYLSALPTGVASPGPGVYVGFTFTGTVFGTDYADAPAGGYEDTVQVTVTP